MQLLHSTPVSLGGVTLRLARLDNQESRACIRSGFGSSTAFISLSPGLVCVFDSPTASGLTHQEVGAAGLSVHQLWNAAADQLTARAQREQGVEFLVRCPTAVLDCASLPRGFEVDGHGVPAAWWLAHPQPFSLLHRHFEAVMQPDTGLVYATRDGRELFVFDAGVDEVARCLSDADVLTYSVGFPLLCRARAH
ncbi:hypothetical protein GC584_01860 [Corynebacterium sp. zg912]|uniref:Uncharacterized protein n=1 Tax=Corynebacterium wankanglinii TaxID=2735136 RepID=A0A7H0K909_9CORY|nr:MULTISPECIES: hypothetical protein [Corynebacterium]MBA1837224.1 hypothetical protein [Corynebacterium wankanglinii]MCR5928199.1 hypothetical protein [Corynebacterium sp. zg912]QNP93775.1 hypothetical protein IA203_08055 [Corynebacterium wankanglinii]